VPQNPDTLKPRWFQILLALASNDLHGLAIMKAVLDQTQGHMRLWPAMLYGSLKQMTEAGLIEEREDDGATDADRRRFYGITDSGRQALSAEVDRLAGYIRLAEERQVADGSVSA
jgi:DNA-binding PadR family transcriptional regulator